MISHSSNQDFVPGEGERVRDTGSGGAVRSGFARPQNRRRHLRQGPRCGGADTMAKRGAAAEAAVSSDEPVSVQCSEQDRRERTGFRAGAFPLGGAAARLFGALRASAQLDVPALDVGGLDLLDRYEERIALEDPFLQTADDMSFFVPWRRGVPETRPGWADHGDAISSASIRASSTEVAFVGRGNFFQIWEPERLRAYGAEVRARLSRLRQGTKPGEQPE